MSSNHTRRDKGALFALCFIAIAMLVGASAVLATAPSTDPPPHGDDGVQLMGSSVPVVHGVSDDGTPYQLVANQSNVGLCLTVGYSGVRDSSTACGFGVEGSGSRKVGWASVPLRGGGHLTFGPTKGMVRDVTVTMTDGRRSTVAARPLPAVQGDEFGEGSLKFFVSKTTGDGAPAELLATGADGDVAMRQAVRK